MNNSEVELGTTVGVRNNINSNNVNQWRQKFNGNGINLTKHESLVRADSITVNGEVFHVCKPQTVNMLSIGGSSPNWSRPAPRMASSSNRTLVKVEDKKETHSSSGELMAELGLTSLLGGLGGFFEHINHVREANEKLGSDDVRKIGLHLDGTVNTNINKVMVDESWAFRSNPTPVKELYSWQDDKKKKLEASEDARIKSKEKAVINNKLRPSSIRRGPKGI